MTRGRQGIVIALCLLAVFLQGCPLSWRRLSLNEVIQRHDASFIIPGTTTLANVVERLGAPSSIKAADTGAQSMRYGDSAAVITVAWLVIDKYRNAKAQPAITSATKPIAVWGTLRIFDNIVQYPSSALVGKARRAGAAAARMARTASVHVTANVTT